MSSDRPQAEEEELLSKQAGLQQRANPPTVSVDLSSVSSAVRTRDVASLVTSLCATNSLTRSAGSSEPHPYEVALDQIAEQTLLAASGQPTDIDNLVKFIAQICDALDAEPPGVQTTHWGDGETTKPRVRTKSRPSQGGGGGVVIERLSRKIFADKLVKPFIESGITPSPRMYQHRRPDLNASLGPAILLARCFAPQPSFRPRLWREVQDMIAKCVLSENMQTPACFLAVSILFQGAGASVRDWMKSNLKGVGRDWIFYMGQFRRPADIWTWDDVMRERLEHDMGSIFEQNLPRDLLELRHEMKMYARTGILPRRLPVRSSPKRLNGYPRGCEP